MTGFDIQGELKKLPNQPGVYLMHDENDTIIYVGKAMNLNRRVHSYFRASTKRTAKIEKMVSQISYFEYIITDSELEALVLENNLIKEHRPKYNTMLKDDKTYPYIKVTVQEEYPRILFSRLMKKDKAKYFGPYTSAASVKDTIDLISKMYRLRTCNRVLPRDIGKERACLNHHMHQCMAPCTGRVSPEEYQENVKRALEFLNGNYNVILKDLEDKMQRASEAMEFEEAIRYRELLASVRSVAQKQKMTQSDGEDKDVIGMAKDEKDAVIQVFFVRDGKLIGREHFYMTNVSEQSDSDILGSFIKQFYAGTPFLPKTIILPTQIEETELVAGWLSQRRGSKVTIEVPQKGSKEKFVDLATRNAHLVLSQDKERIRREEGRTIGAVKEIASLIGLREINRIEAFDISNISGFQNVGSMVVFEKGKPHRSDYRKFRIKSVSGPDDYACMKEVLTRRFMHGLEEKQQLKEEEMEEQFGSFSKFPDLLLMDGGKGQVNIAREVLGELSIDIPVCGMVKDDNHRTRGLYFNNQEVDIDRYSEGFKLITRIQDEAHRFAIEFHRSLRRKSNVHSVLDDIRGIGPARRKALMKTFDNIDAIKNAEVEDLMRTPGMTRGVAEEIYRHFRDPKGGENLEKSSTDQ
ncbi:MAG: excinuclease ABC subunit UvrC [Lachnospiraceae bacterium]|nr:excinuclease ABC subunit UvrC [Lachnospiraceae bacterium]